ncbi:HD domain-containing protein [Micromonospora echinospora]|uniref:HD domain-containing protein n=1 Tax=Micromonospora echinospora TaxID=1877 RepID=UPI0033D7FE53
MSIGITRSGMRVPTDSQIRALHERFAPTLDAFELVYTHCRIVCELAEQLLANREHDLDVELVRAGCLLHDIGVYRLYDSSGGLEQGNYVRHGMLGHELLRDLGFPEILCRFCSCHTGMGLSRDDVVRQRLPLPVDDYLAESDEERLVMYADKFHSKRNPPVFVSAATYVSGVRQFGRDKVDRFAKMVEQFGEPDLTPLANNYGHIVV